MHIPDGFTTCLTEINTILENIEGFLTRREVEFLALAAGCPSAKGCILEIGSHQGKSTVVLAKAAALTEQKRVVACDPLTSPSETDPDLKGAKSCKEAFDRNLKRADVTDAVDFNQTFSQDLAKDWKEPIRLLWIDGDHNYTGVMPDFDNFMPFVQPGAIVALHDVLHPFDGPIRVFMENMILNKEFDRIGMVGSIGWGRWVGPQEKYANFDSRMKLYTSLARLIPHYLDKRKSNFLRRKLYLARRAFVPHARISPTEFILALS